MYINYRKQINSWAIGHTHRERNHPMNPDPFPCIEHEVSASKAEKERKLGRNTKLIWLLFERIPLLHHRRLNFVLLVQQTDTQGHHRG